MLPKGGADAQRPQGPLSLTPCPGQCISSANAEAKSCALPCRRPHPGWAPSKGRKCRRRRGPLAVSPGFSEECGFPPQAPSKRGEFCFFFFIHTSYPQPGLPSWRSPRRSAVTRALPGCGQPHTSRDAEVTPWCGHFWGGDCSEGKGKHILSLHLCSFPSRVHPITTVASTVVCLKCFSEMRQLKTPQNWHQDLCPFWPPVGRLRWEGRAHAAACLETLWDNEWEGRVTGTCTALTHPRAVAATCPSTKYQPHVVPWLLGTRCGRSLRREQTGFRGRVAHGPPMLTGGNRCWWPRAPGLDRKRPVCLPVRQKSTRNAVGRTAL